MKTLIASLGGNRPKNDQQKNTFNYPTTEYKFDNCPESFKTPFLFEAIINYHKLQKNNIDQIFLVGTVHSCWSDILGYCINNKATDESKLIYYYELEKKTAALNRKSSVKEIETFQDFLHPLEREIETFLSDKNDISVHILITQYGTTEDETFYNYRKLCSIENYMPIELEHDLLLDITHSFRSMPIYNFLIINYFMRISELKVNVSAIYYGMFELKREEQLEHTPVINMNYLLSMMNWINGLNEMNSYGSVEGINHCLKNNIDINNWLKIFEWASNTNNYNLLTKSVYKLSNSNYDGKIYNVLEKDALTKISSLMKKQFELHSDYKIAYMQLKLSEWFFEQRRYGLAIITIQECLKSYITYITLNNTPNNRQITESMISDENTRNDAINKLQQLAKENSYAEKLVYYYKAGKNMRNTTAHVLRNTDTQNKETLFLLTEIDKDKKLLQDYINYVAKCMKEKHIENAFESINAQNMHILNSPYKQIVFIGKKKNNWNWTSLIKKYEITTQDLHFYEPENYVRDYQTTNQIKIECENIKKQIDKLVSGKKTLIIIGNTNLEKQVTLIKRLQTLYSDVKLLGECGRSGNYIFVTDKNIPFKIDK